MLGLKSNLCYASNWLYGEMVSTLELKYSDLFLISVDHSILRSSDSICRENLVKKKLLKNDFQLVRCLGWLVSFQNITLSTANDNVENNNHLNPLGLEPGTLRVLDARDNHYTMESLQVKV